MQHLAQAHTIPLGLFKVALPVNSFNDLRNKLQANKMGSELEKTTKGKNKNRMLNYCI